jgi:hypothetical protein
MTLEEAVCFVINTTPNANEAILKIEAMCRPKSEVKRYNTECFYTIPGSANENGKWTVPVHPDIPRRLHGVEVSCKMICWQETEER